MIIALPIRVSSSNLDHLVQAGKGLRHIDFDDGNPPMEITQRNAKKFVTSLIDGGHVIKYYHGVFKIIRT